MVLKLQLSGEEKLLNALEGIHKELGLMRELLEKTMIRKPEDSAKEVKKMMDMLSTTMREK
jgi:hypothetical protein